MWSVILILLLLAIALLLVLLLGTLRVALLLVRGWMGKTPIHVCVRKTKSAVGWRGSLFLLLLLLLALLRAALRTFPTPSVGSVRGWMRETGRHVRKERRRNDDDAMKIGSLCTGGWSRIMLLLRAVLLQAALLQAVLLQVALQAYVG
jgi:hypothetical protein